jgi:hypothetical protein
MYQPLDVKEAVSNEINNQKGRMLVSSKLLHEHYVIPILTITTVCVHKEMGDKIRKTVAHNLDKDIKLVELDFDPYQPKSSGRAKTWFRAFSEWKGATLKDEEKETQSKTYSNWDGPTLMNEERETQSKL